MPREAAVRAFDLGRILQSAGRTRRSVRYEPGQVIFSQGAPRTRILYVQRGVVKRSLLSPAGKPRNIRIEEDLVDVLFNSSEKRLARTLLLHARYGKREAAPQALPKLSQEGLAETIGTTRSRVSFFMNTFRKLGFIDYDADGVMVHPSLVSVVLHEVSRKRLMLGCSHRALPSRSSSSMRFSALARSVAASRAIAISPAR